METIRPDYYVLWNTDEGEKYYIAEKTGETDKYIYVKYDVAGDETSYFKKNDVHNSKSEQGLYNVLTSQQWAAYILVQMRQAYFNPPDGAVQSASQEGAGKKRKKGGNPSVSKEAVSYFEEFPLYDIGADALSALEILGGGKRRKKKTRKKIGGLREEIPPFPFHLISEQAQNAYNNNENVRRRLNFWWTHELTPHRRAGIALGTVGGRFEPNGFRVFIDETIRRLQEQQQGGRRKKKTRKKRGGLDSFPIGMLDQLSQDTIYNNPHKDDLIRRLNHIWNILGEDEEDQEAFKDLIRRNPNSFYQVIIHFIQQAEAEHHGGRRKKKKTRKRRKGGRKKTRKKRKRNKTRRKRRTKKAGFTSRSKLEEGIEGCNKLKESSKILDCRNIGGLKNYHQQQTKKSFFKKIHLPHRPHFHRETKTERHNREMRDMEWDFGSFGQN